jgi:diadenosine tetraphosphatase ApaH/serine/threonine PP2A family protein phosphatase
VRVCSTTPEEGAATPPIAILSDIHGNRHALTAVLAAVRSAGVRRWWCLGDMVGYGADPLHTLTVCMGQAERCIVGNHDLGAAGRIPLRSFSHNAHEALEWTRMALGQIGIDKLATHEPSDPGARVSLFHASPRDPVWEYLADDDPEPARAALEAVDSPLVLVGHTHVPMAWHLRDDGSLSAAPIDQGPISLTPGRWLVNPGAVGQPRDGNPRASWALYDPGAATIEVRRTEYDIAGAQAAIRAVGLPESCAARLEEGH